MLTENNPGSIEIHRIRRQSIFYRLYIYFLPVAAIEGIFPTSVTTSIDFHVNNILQSSFRQLFNLGSAKYYSESDR